MRAPAAVFALVGAICAASPAAADPRDDLRDAENSYLYGDYPRVIEKLARLVEPDILLADPDDQARAYELLGLSSFFLDQKVAARTWFERLIRFRPDTRLNPVLVPPPAVSFFDGIRDDLAEEIARIEDELRKQREADAARRRLEQLTRVRVDVQVNSRLVATLPFGVGQFQNGDDALGYTLLSSQAISGALSLGAFTYIESLRLTNGQFDRADVDRAQTAQDLQLWSGGVALALMVGGVIHAWATFVDERPLRQVDLPPLSSGATGDGFLRWTF